MKIKLIVIAILLLAGCHSTQTEVTTNKNKEGMTSYVNAHITSVAVGTDKVRFVTDGRIIPATHPVPANEPFFINIGERLRTAPDHHTSTEFVYKGIRDGSVLLEYEQTFDHRSFGKNLITIDRGEVLVSLKTE
ncbi:MAG TPA: hypothetical protein VHL14_13420 [Steroidobacteraceae bacterium]|nr:hypothetical protein [Steroidobacteraceae bacterium]